MAACWEGDTNKLNQRLTAVTIHDTHRDDGVDDNDEGGSTRCFLTLAASIARSGAILVHVLAFTNFPVLTVVVVVFVVAFAATLISMYIPSPLSSCRFSL